MTDRLSDSFLAGSISGVATRFVSSPLDVLKVRLQLQVESSSRQPFSKGQVDSAHRRSPLLAQHPLPHGRPKYGGVFHAARTILVEEGIAAFWKGFLAGQLLYISFSGTQFTFFELWRRQLLRLHGSGHSLSESAVINFVSGCGAGSAATLVSFPFDILRTRMIGQGEPKVYSSLFQAVRMMYSDSGIRGFYRGLSPALLSVTPQAGLYFSIYIMTCGLWERSTFMEEEGGESMKWAVCGGVAGVTSKIIMLPFDMIKKRLEIQGFEQARRRFGAFHQYNGPFHCLKTIYKHEGPLAFYKGATPSLMKATFGVSLSFTIYEHILKFLRDLR